MTGLANISASFFLISLTNIVTRYICRKKAPRSSVFLYILAIIYKNTSLTIRSLTRLKHLTSIKSTETLRSLKIFKCLNKILSILVSSTVTDSSRSVCLSSFNFVTSTSFSVRQVYFNFKIILCQFCVLCTTFGVSLPAGSTAKELEVINKKSGGVDLRATTIYTTPRVLNRKPSALSCYLAFSVKYKQAGGIESWRVCNRNLEQ